MYGAVISWVNDNGYECAGPMFNIYHVSPHETQDPDEYVTEASRTDIQITPCGQKCGQNT